MSKTIFITGATDGIGFETAKQLAAAGNTLLLHGRSASKLEACKASILALYPQTSLSTYLADLSDFQQVLTLAKEVISEHSHLDVLINNAGVFKVSDSITSQGLDVRFVVNTLAPYVLTKALLLIMTNDSRVVNLSSAAQAPVALMALSGKQRLSDSEAYAQSKLAITMWTFQLAKSWAGNTPTDNAPSLVAINPASFLGSKMVKQAYGSDGKDLRIGADILTRAATSGEFANVSGRYFDNDIGVWAQPHPDALDEAKNIALMSAMEDLLAQYGISV